MSRLKNLSGTSDSAPHTKVHPDVQTVFLVMPSSSCPITGHHLNRAGCILFALSLQVFIDIGEVHSPIPGSDKLNIPSSLNQVKYLACSIPQINLLGYVSYDSQNTFLDTCNNIQIMKPSEGNQTAFT